MLKSVLDGTHDIHNFYKYPADMLVYGKYDMPVIKGIKFKGKRLKTVAFDECHLISKSQRKQYIVHFFIYDYKFERIWTYINKYTDFLKQFKAVISPDFSQYTDMPRAMQIWNLWRCNFMAYWWQSHGIPVIYNACWSDSSSFDYTWDGAPRGSLVCVTSKGNVYDDRKQTKDESLIATSSRFKAGFESMIENLHPAQILWMGVKPKWLENLAEENNIQLITADEYRDYQNRLDSKKT